jgi:dienelactone hydrolase
LGLLGLVAGSSDLILKPIKPDTNGTQVIGVLIFQGAQISPEGYEELGRRIQSASPLSLWVSVPSAIADVENPGLISFDFERAIQNLYDYGFPQDGKFFVVAHSLGGIAAQEYISGHSDNVIGLALCGASLQRKYRNDNKFPVPTLVVAGELDGLFRVTRVVEEYYNRIEKSGIEFQAAALTFPVTIIKGMSHIQFATSDPPTLVRYRDLSPEITGESAREQAAAIMSHFLSYLVTENEADSSAILNAVQQTKDFSKPIIEAFELEGARGFNRPHQKGGFEENCPRGLCEGEGSPWSPTAQRYIADEDALKKLGYSLNVTDSYVQLSALPPFGDFHLPTITANPQDPSVLDLPIYSQCFWDKLEGFDTGFISVSALEIGVKMISQQCIRIRGAGVPKEDAPFSLDDPDFCAEVNQKAYEWAFTHASGHTKSRFEKTGQRLTFGPDQKKSGGPFWINAHLSFEDKTLDNGDVVKEVSAPMIKTAEDFIKIPGLPDPSCYHYCKLLSPARAMEWIYVDGLRLRGGLQTPE